MAAKLTKLSLLIAKCKMHSIKIQFLYFIILFIPSLITTWLFDPLLNEVESDWLNFSALLLSAFGLVLWSYIFHFFGKIGYILGFTASCILVAFTYINLYYNIIPSPVFMGDILQTTFDEVSSQVKPYILFSTLLPVLGYMALLIWSKRYFSRINFFIFAVLAVHAVFAQSSDFTSSTPRAFRIASRWSMDYVANPVKFAIDYPKKNKKLADDLRNMPDPSLTPAERTRDDRLIIVFVVGESLRADHLGINGYQRDTTPLLAKENLVNFKNAQSYATRTRESVVAMFSNYDPEQKIFSHGSFVKILRKLGFDITTYAASIKPTVNDYSITIMTEGARRFLSGRPDIKLVQLLSEHLGEQALEMHVVLPYGSHADYYDGYPREDAVFLPDDYRFPITPERLQSLINSYDNTVRYTDKILASIIDELRDNNAILIYMSDHGESLGENGRFTHGHANAAEQSHVPFFFWFSDRYKENHRDLIEALQSRTDDQVTQHSLFHTILALADIKTELINPELNLAGPTDN